MTDDAWCGCSVSEKEEEESKYTDSHKVLVFNRPEDKKQKENETRELLHRTRIICFSRVDVDDQLMIVNVKLYDILVFSIFFFEERLVILNISKPSGCLQ